MKKLIIIWVLGVAIAGAYPTEPYDETMLQQSHSSGALQLAKAQEMIGVRYSGEISLSGVIEWHLYHEANGDYYAWELRFYPDDISVLPNENPSTPSAKYGIRLLAKPLQSMLASMDSKANLRDLRNIFGKDFSQNDMQILGAIAMRVNITLFDYIITHTDLYEVGLTIAQYKDIKPLGKIERYYTTKGEKYSHVFYASKDSYINLRESPNGKILKAIQKDETIKDCDTRDTNKGVIIQLGVDSKNPKWLKVAYIPPESKDTSKAIYGVIHESQVSYSCGN